MTLYFTSDQHWGHSRIIDFCNRPFASVHEMNVALTDNWNSVVKKEDTVYHLGDFCFGNPKPYLEKLNGKIILIRGSHDKRIKCFPEVHDLFTIRPKNDITIVLCHYCLRTWDKSHFNSWHLYGHSHGKLPSIGKSHDVGVDCNNFTPISLDQIIEIMKTKEDNPNLIKKTK